MFFEAGLQCRDLRFLLFEQGALLGYLAMFLQEFIQQHGVYRFVADGVWLAIFVACHEIGRNFRNVLGHQAKLRDACRV